MFATAAERFYPIVDTALCLSHGTDALRLAESLFDAGTRVIQLRMKAGSSAEILQVAEALVEHADRYGAHVIVNDRADLARMARAAGVHVGQDDMPPRAARSVFPDAVIGLSTHDAAQIEAALVSDADYIAVGPIFDTRTKETGYSARGLDLVRLAARGPKPVVAIGGIDLERAPAVITAGAAAVAVISDLFSGGDPGARARAYVRRLS